MTPPNRLRLLTTTATNPILNSLTSRYETLQQSIRDLIAKPAASPRVSNNGFDASAFLEAEDEDSVGFPKNPLETFQIIKERLLDAETLSAKAMHLKQVDYVKLAWMMRQHQREGDYEYRKELLLRESNRDQEKKMVKTSLKQDHRTDHTLVKRLGETKAFLESADGVYKPLDRPGACPAGWNVVADFPRVGFGKPAHRIYLNGTQHERPQIVIAARGTYSPLDVVTDLVVDAVEFQEGHAHDGILRAGTYLADKFGPILKRMGGLGDVVLAGHSLAGGAVSVAGILLKEKYGLEGVKVVGFGSPPILTPGAGRWCDDFITTYVNRDDVVSRLSERNLVKLHLSLIDMKIEESILDDVEEFFLETFKLPERCPESHRLFVEDLARRAHARISTHLTANHLYHIARNNHRRRGSAKGNDLTSSSSCELESALRKQLETAPDFVLPGKIIHVVRQSEPSSSSSLASLLGRERPRQSKEVVKARVVESGDLGEIRLTTTMVSDHLTRSYLGTFESAEAMSVVEEKKARASSSVPLARVLEIPKGIVCPFTRKALEVFRSDLGELCER